MNQLVPERLLTESGSTEQEAQRLDDGFRAIFDNAPFGICTIGIDMGFIHVNDALCRILGYSGEELVGTDWTRLVHPDDIGTSIQKMEGMIQGSEACQEIETRILRCGGSVICARLQISFVQIDASSQPWFVVQMEDV